LNDFIKRLKKNWVDNKKVW